MTKKNMVIKTTVKHDADASNAENVSPNIRRKRVVEKTAFECASPFQPRRRLMFVDKLLSGQRIYIDPKALGNLSLESLENGIDTLGGVVEKFLSKDVTQIVADQKEYTLSKSKLENDANSSPITFSRGQSLLARATNKRRLANNIFLTAKQLGIKVVDIAKFYSDIQRELSKCDPNTKWSQVEIDSAEVKRSPNAVKKKKLKGDYLKHEDDSGLFRPVFAKLSHWPCLYIDQSLSGCPFDVKPTPLLSSTGTIQINTPPESHTLSKVESRPTSMHKNTAKNRIKANKRKTVTAKSGYCESCNETFSDLRLHLKSKSHIDFISKRTNFADLDSFISTVPLLNEVHKENVDTTEKNAVDVSVLHETISQRRCLLSPQKRDVNTFISLSLHDPTVRSEETMCKTSFKTVPAVLDENCLSTENSLFGCPENLSTSGNVIIPEKLSTQCALKDKQSTLSCEDPGAPYAGNKQSSLKGYACTDDPVNQVNIEEGTLKEGNESVKNVTFDYSDISSPDKTSGQNDMISMALQTLETHDANSWCAETDGDTNVRNDSVVLPFTQNSISATEPIATDKATVDNDRKDSYSFSVFNSSRPINSAYPTQAPIAKVLPLVHLDVTKKENETVLSHDLVTQQSKATKVNETLPTNSILSSKLGEIIQLDDDNPLPIYEPTRIESVDESRNICPRLSCDIDDVPFSSVLQDEVYPTPVLSPKEIISKNSNSCDMVEFLQSNEFHHIENERDEKNFRTSVDRKNKYDHLGPTCVDLSMPDIENMIETTTTFISHLEPPTLEKETINSSSGLELDKTLVGCSVVDKLDKICDDDVASVASSVDVMEYNRLVAREARLRFSDVSDCSEGEKSQPVSPVLSKEESLSSVSAYSEVSQTNVSACPSTKSKKFDQTEFKDKHNAPVHGGVTRGFVTSSVENRDLLLNACRLSHHKCKPKYSSPSEHSYCGESVPQVELTEVFEGHCSLENRTQISGLNILQQMCDEISESSNEPFSVENESQKSVHHDFSSIGHEKLGTNQENADNRHDFTSIVHNISKSCDSIVSASLSDSSRDSADPFLLRNSQGVDIERSLYESCSGRSIDSSLSCKLTQLKAAYLTEGPDGNNDKSIHSASINSSLRVPFSDISNDSVSSLDNTLIANGSESGVYDVRHSKQKSSRKLSSGYFSEAHIPAGPEETVYSNENKACQGRKSVVKKQPKVSTKASRKRCREVCDASQEPVAKRRPVRNAAVVAMVAFSTNSDDERPLDRHELVCPTTEEKCRTKTVKATFPDENISPILQNHQWKASIVSDLKLKVSKIPKTPTSRFNDWSVKNSGDCKLTLSAKLSKSGQSFKTTPCGMKKSRKRKLVYE